MRKRCQPPQLPDPTAPYGNMFFRRHVHQKEWQRAFGQLLAKTFKASSAADFGCGNGYMVEGMLEGGLKAVGFEPNLKSAWKYVPESVKPHILCRNLSEPADVGKFDLVVSIEVAEHLPPDKGAVLRERFLSVTSPKRSRKSWCSPRPSQARGAGPHQLPPDVGVDLGIQGRRLRRRQGSCGRDQEGGLHNDGD